MNEAPAMQSPTSLSWEMPQGCFGVCRESIAIPQRVGLVCGTKGRGLLWGGSFGALAPPQEMGIFFRTQHACVLKEIFDRSPIYSFIWLGRLQLEQISLHILECYLIKVMTANKHSDSIPLPHHLQLRTAMQGLRC